MAIGNTTEVTLNINSQNAKARLEELQKMTGNLTESIKKAYDAGDTKTAKALTAELKKTNKEIADIQKNSDNLAAAMKNLSTATPKELRKTLAAINKELNSGNVARGSKEWQMYNQQLVRVKAELAKINDEQKAAAPLSQRLGDAFGRMKGLALAAGVGIAGLGASLQKMREYRDQKDTSRAGLQALTGLDDASVGWLQQQAETMSQTMDETGLRVTQSASEIMEAYKLVGSAKPELLAVKEDLNKVTIEAIRLSQAAGIDLNQAVTAVTTSMNQFGASANETDRYVNVLAAGSKVGAVAVENINEAVLKSGVAASQAGLKIEELVGAIETIGERGLQGGDAGTGLKNFFLTLSQGADDTNPKIVGMQQALENLKAKNLSTAEMVQMFGKNAYNVASILVDSTDAFAKYTEGVTGTQTAVEQAAIMGDTFAAKSAQLKNELAELGQKILQTLQPAINAFMDGATGALKVIAALVKAFKDYAVVIVPLVTAIVAYNVAIAVQNALHAKAVTAVAAYIKSLFSMQTLEKAVTAGKYLLAAATALLTGNVKKATQAWKLFSAALKLSPVGLIAAAIAAVVVGLAVWIKRSKQLTQEQRNQQAVQQMNLDIEKKVADETATEISRIKQLQAAIHDKNRSEKSRTAAIKELQKIIPAYNAQISKEGEIINENTAAVKAYIETLKQKARMKASEAMLADVTRERLQAEIELENERKRIELERQAYEHWQEGTQSDNAEVNALIEQHSGLGGLGYNYGEIDKAQKRIDALADSISQLQAKEADLVAFIEKNEAATGAVPGMPAEPTESGNGGSRNDQLNALAQQAEKAKLEIEKAFKDGRTTYAQYKKDLLDTDKWLIERQQALFTVSEKEWTDYERKKLELKAKYVALDDELLQLQAKDDTAALQVRYAQAKVTTEQYQTELLQIEIDTLQRRLQLYKDNSREYADLNAQLAQKLAEQDKQTRARAIAEIEADYKQLTNLLTLRYAKGEMSEKEYNEAVFQAEIQHLIQVRNAYVEFSDDYIATQKKIEDAEAKHQQELAKAYNEGLKNFNAAYTTKIAQQEYSEGAAQIDEMLKRGDIAFEDAARAKSDLAQKLLDAETKQIQAGNLSIIDTYKARFEAIENLEKKGVLTHEQAEAAKVQATNDMLGQISNLYQEAWGNIDTILSASSNLIQANADLETAKIEAEYEKRIDAAGRNHRKVEKLEKERDQKIDAEKTKANEKAMKIQIAQAIAQTAQAAINAYSSASAIPVAGWVLGPIAAAAALAAGAIQVAAIKKQQQAQAAGYASGGFTPSGRWDEPQGIVHSDEFVANRFATGNAEIRPALNLIDRAQRNNTVGSLTADDVTASLYSRTSPDVVKAVNAQTPAAGATPQAADNAAALEANAAAIAANADVLRRLSDQLDEGITAIASIDGRNGIDRQQKKYNQLINNAR